MRKDLFFLILLVGVALLLGRKSRPKISHNKFYTDEKYLPVSKKQLLHIALWPHLRKYFGIVLPIILLLAVACIARRISVFVAAVSIGIIAGILFVLIFPMIHMQYLPLAYLRTIPDFDVIFSEKKLCWGNGAWGYADAQWFIRVSDDYSVVLQASDIDFQIPVKRVARQFVRTNGLRGTGRTVVVYVLHFHGKNKKTIIAHTDADRNISNWIAQHGGKIEQ